MAAGIGTGATVAFPSPTAYPMEVLAINVSGIERGVEDITHLGTTIARAFLEHELYDGGTVELEVHLPPVSLQGNDPPGLFDNTHGTLLITLPSGATFSAPAKATGFDFGIPLEGKMTGTARFKIAGAITLQNGS